MKGCAHDKIFSGRTNLDRRFEWICRECGEIGWDELYEIDRVDQPEFYAQRVIHGWAGPRASKRVSAFPRPPRLPSNMAPSRPRGPWLPAMVFFLLLMLVCGLSTIPWGALGPLMPPWMALMGAGLALLTATVCYVAWKRGYE